MDAAEARIVKVFGTKEVPRVSRENLLKYRKYLLQHLDRKAILTGCEDFPWEEKYVLGGWSRAEYEKLKKTNPSYTDEYELIDILEDDLPENDLIAQVKRRSDGKVFEIGLSWLTTKKEKRLLRREKTAPRNDGTKDFQLLDDFVTWVVNW
jgi:hypothetical protein